MLPRTQAKLALARHHWIKPILVIVVITGTLRSAVADWNVVPTGSMKPNIIAGDRIFVNKLAYGLRFPFTDWQVMRWSEPQRSDIVIFFAPGKGTRMVKRVIGLPGDTIQLFGNRLIVNGQPVGYESTDDRTGAAGRGAEYLATEQLSGGAHPIMLTPNVPAPRSFGPVTVPQDHYLLLGDNRDRSADSRWFGFVHRDEIVGRSSRIILSLDANNYYLPRSDRFFRSLP